MGTAVPSATGALLIAPKVWRNGSTVAMDFDLVGSLIEETETEIPDYKVNSSSFSCLQFRSANVECSCITEFWDVQDNWWVLKNCSSKELSKQDGRRAKASTLSSRDPLIIHSSTWLWSWFWKNVCHIVWGDDLTNQPNTAQATQSNRGQGSLDFGRGPQETEYRNDQPDYTSRQSRFLTADEANDKVARSEGLPDRMGQCLRGRQDATGAGNAPGKDKPLDVQSIKMSEEDLNGVSGKFQ